MSHANARCLSSLEIRRSESRGVLFGSLTIVSVAVKPVRRRAGRVNEER